MYPEASHRTVASATTGKGELFSCTSFLVQNSMTKLVNILQLAPEPPTHTPKRCRTLEVVPANGFALHKDNRKALLEPPKTPPL